MCPTKKNRWVFGSWFGDKYSDNSKYFYEFLLKNKQNRVIYWITSNKNVFNELKYKNYPVKYKYNIKTILFLMRAEYVFITSGKADVFPFGSSFFKNIIIQLWHGIPIKKVMMLDNNIYNRSNKISTKIKYLLFPGIKLKFDYITASSDSLYDIYKNKIFINMYKKDILRIIQPRTEYLLNLQTTNNIILYAPTHRNCIHTNLDINFESYNKILPNEKELKLINDICVQSNIVFVIRLHYCAEKYINKLNLSNYSNIRTSINSDINDDFKETKILITDISSLIFDFDILKKNIICCFPDYKEYSKKNRELIYKIEDIYDENCITFSWKDCINKIEFLIKNENYYPLKINMNQYLNNGMSNLYELLKD